ncbi:hypothetical protein FQA39_LY17148 [Lamprigera yunnana]|nr:hypothetical protein FQA39_LY17148 [Lamprigera yunnana]
MDKYIDKEKLISFKSSENWNGDNQDLSLFTFYKNIFLEYNLEKEIKNIHSKKSAGEQDTSNLISEDEEVNNNSINQAGALTLENSIQDLNTEINAQETPISEADTFNMILVQVDVHKSATYDPYMTSEEHNDEEPEEKTVNDYKEGEYILVKFLGSLKNYKYVCIIQKLFENSEAEVLDMNCCDGNKTVFKPNDSDISFIKLDKILKKLPNPKITIAGERLKCQFLTPIEVDG